MAPRSPLCRTRLTVVERLDAVPGLGMLDRRGLSGMLPFMGGRLRLNAGQVAVTVSLVSLAGLQFLIALAFLGHLGAHLLPSSFSRIAGSLRGSYSREVSANCTHK